MKRISVALVAGLLVTALCAAQSNPGADVSNFRQEGIASWYGTEFDGRPTASGEVFNSSQYTAAHPSLPFGTLLTVTNLNNGRKVNVRVNDRGPFVSSRIIDLSQAAAAMLDMVAAGTAPVLVESMSQGSQGSSPAYSQGNAYQAETTAQARSEGGYSNANSQIIAPSYQAPSYQQPTYQQQPTYSAAPQAAEPVVVQVQPPQQQITQYFQQPPQQQVQTQPQYQQTQPQYQQTQPQYQQTQPQYQQAPQQAPVQQQTQPPVQQQILPVQQIIQPMQPMVAPTPQAAAPAAAPVQPVVTAQTATQQLQPLQINIPIEVRPVITETAAPVAAAPTAPAPTAPAPYAAPASVPETPAPVTPTVAPIPPAPIAAAPVSAPVSAPPATTAQTVLPNKVYRVQVGSYKEARNALSAFERLKNVGLNPLYERNGDYFRVVLTEIPSEEINGVLQKLGTAGFSDPLLREER